MMHHGQKGTQADSDALKFERLLAHSLPKRKRAMRELAVRNSARE